jgi:hypothetical protein
LISFYFLAVHLWSQSLHSPASPAVALVGGKKKSRSLLFLLLLVLLLLVALGVAVVVKFPHHVVANTCGPFALKKTWQRSHRYSSRGISLSRSTGVGIGQLHQSL